MGDQTNETELAIRKACDAGDHDRAATLTIEAYGREILGFLMSRMATEDDACEVFSIFSEEYWKSLKHFQFRCSARTWAYKLARRAAGHYAKSAQRRRAQQVGVSTFAGLSQAVAQARTATLKHQKTDVKDRFQRMREHLDVEEQTLLVLRVDRRMAWDELAEVMGGEDELDAATRKRESARLRKRYQSVKDKLRKLAKEEGLLDPPEGR